MKKITFELSDKADGIAHIKYDGLEIGFMLKGKDNYVLKILGEDYRHPLNKKRTLKEYVLTVYKTVSKLHYINSSDRDLSVKALKELEEPKQKKLKK